ncbi:hypothetical protein V0288_13255 [Pannus brasiliensis CCIBt3594]|uniref:Uncharacterized protein n=1 Tax=Pannus brasiliensis CCIBt3594 TaxID=1427578 RepID=A0AAW9QYT3_9CHRO
MSKIVAIGQLALLWAIGGVFSPALAQSPTPSGQQQPTSGQYQISDAMLQDYVSDQNQKLPSVIDNQIRWDSIALGTGRTLIYNYTFLDPSIAGINPSETDQIKGSIVQTVCGNDQIRALLDDAVNFNFKYHGSRGNFLTEIRVNRNDCR